MKIRTRTVLFNTDRTLAELRVYVQPFTMAQLPVLKQQVLDALGKVNAHPTDEQLGLYSNRAGIHFYCVVRVDPNLLRFLKQSCWKEAKKLTLN
jgi:hypothetical protein